jgi:hypothetical protein
LSARCQIKNTSYYKPNGGDWRKQHNVKLNNLYSLSSIIRKIKSKRMRWAEHEAPMGAKGAYRTLVGKPEEKRLLERPSHRWKDNIKLVLGNGKDWIDLVQDREQWKALVNIVMKLQVQ